MLVVRREQLAAFAQDRRRRLVDELEAYAREHFPAACAAMDARDLSATIDAAVAGCHSLGVRSGRGLRRYVNLTMTCGPGFATDPALPWARAHLDDAAVPDPEERLARLHTAVALRLEQGRAVR